MTQDISLKDFLFDIKSVAIATLFRWPEWKVVTTALAGVGIAVFPSGTHAMYYLLGSAYLLDLAFGLIAARLMGEKIESRKLFKSFGTLLFYVSFPIMLYKMVDAAPVVGGEQSAYWFFYLGAATCVGKALNSILENVDRADMMETETYRAILKMATRRVTPTKEE